MQIISMDKEDAFEVITPLRISDHHSESLEVALSSSHCSLLLAGGLEGTSSYQRRQDSAPRFIVVFTAQLKALRNSSKLLMAPITLQRQK